MQNGLNIKINEVGNLEITATKEGIEYLQDQIESANIADAETGTITWKESTIGIWIELLESYSCNGSYNLCPDNTFALCSAPCIADIPQTYDDMAENNPRVMYSPETKFWQLSNYMVVDEREILLNGGTVVFDRIPEDSISENTKDIAEICQTLYNENGVSAVCDYANENNLPYSYCKACEADMPVHSNNCLVCGQTLRNIQDENIISLRKMFNNNDYTVYSKEQMEKEWERRALLREEEEKKKLTTEQKLKFILANDPEYNRYDIDKIYQSNFCNALNKKLSYTHFSNGCNYLFNRYKVNFENTIAQEVARFEKFIVEDMRISIDDFKLYYYLKGLFISHSFRKRENANEYRASGHYNNYLCELIQFLDGGKYENDLKAANDFLDSHKINYATGSYSYTIGNITVKTFLNGRVDIKGLNSKQQKTINLLFNIHDKVKNR